MLALRAHLDAAQLFDTKIVVYDNWVYADPLPAGAAAAGIHYPGIGTGRPELGFPMWSSEESSTYNNDVGAGCWARVVNQNYVSNNMTASLAWNLVAAYMKRVPFTIRPEPTRQLTLAPNPASTEAQTGTERAS